MASSPIILIPARMASTRLPNKPLADICGLPMIVQVLRRAQEAKIGRVVVAEEFAKEPQDSRMPRGSDARGVGMAVLAHLARLLRNDTA